MKKMTKEFLDRPLFSLTVSEFLEVMKDQIEEMNDATAKAKIQTKTDVTAKYVHGLEGIAKLFGCSKTTAWRIKNSGRIDGAIKQVGHVIVTDVEMAIRLAGEEINPRKNAAIGKK